MVKIVEKIEEANCITHSGTMHADEVFATAFLELYLGDRKVFRTNDVDFSRVSCDALIYDVGRGEFDHHQIDALKRENGIPYSSFGLLWRAFGKEFLTNQNISYVEDVFLEIDKDFVEAIDAEDNGVFPVIDAKYKVKTLSSLFKIFNPSYHSSQNESEQFLKAVEVAKILLGEEIISAYGKVQASLKVKNLLDSLEEDTTYLVLDEYLPYEEVLLNTEKANSILFVAFPSNRGGYAIKTVPKSSVDRSARMDFPEEWAGYSGKELEEKSGIVGLRFCHKGRFIVSCDQLDTVYEVMRQVCLNEKGRIL